MSPTASARRALSVGVWCVALTLSACVSTAGPFITDIRADAQGNLILEKCMVEHEQIGSYGSVQNGTCRTYLLEFSKVKPQASSPAASETRTEAAPPETSMESPEPTPAPE